MAGIVEAIAVTGQAEGSMELLDDAQATAGRGLSGDRYFSKEGTFSNDPGDGRDLTLTEAEALETLRAEWGITLRPDEHRRNLTTRGIDLNALVGRRFYVGEVLCEGIRLCEPCEHLEALTGRQVMRPLLHRAGLRANILAGGIIRVGDAIAEAPVPLAEAAS
jgi:MOSC domain-containing protein YiiM